MSSSQFPPLSGFKLAFAALVLSLGNFMVVLDTTITNVAMPTISGYLGVSTDEGTWIITAYAVAEAITVPLTGWLALQFGQVRVFVWSVALFVLFSVCCGLSWSMPSLVLFRVLQGLAGGPLIPLSSTLLLAAFPEKKSNIALALWGMMTVVAPIIGPILGGVITDNWRWQWVFYINIGFGLLVGLGTLWVLHGRETIIRRSRFDGIGLALLVLFVSAFQTMLDKGRDLDWFSSNLIVTCAVVAAISLVLFIIWELTDDHPVIDLSVFKSRNWLISTITLCLMYGIFFGNIVLTPLWLQQWMGYTATWAGYATAPMGILAVVTSPIVGRLLPKIDPRLLVSYGMGVLALSFVMRALMTSQVGVMSVAVPMFILGAGIPACVITLTSLGVSDLSAEKIAGGSGLQNFLRVLCMAVGSSLTQTYWDHMTKFSRAELVAAIDPFAPMDVSSKLAHAGVPPQSAIAMFSRMVDSQAVMLATNDFYQEATFLMLASIAVVWLIKRPKGPLKKVTGH
ncbi:multidrug resistance protein B [Burkholderia vietnamiensis]|jgi:DHA2 family multidrug resistance protein|uniref:DHA2 family efflux MFS transporter permease subunit n=1 Tax=Burkholderia cepacia complex TaxID=87882 RepID=UPI0007619D25|nr:MULTISPECIES: DHA2 family efflux MFS transporter permease subunit [Burkholderia cepacia complex]KVS41296.1 multidrug resistance protein B [Burkholderia vietnamiensis]MBU9640068.1 DHA2 family efflux MFS transporter permease subunit [Burkholderia multivorans]PRE94858.1 MFS transporter [Burkholderia multivorans]PRG41482.1 MFS transporter [Burkholderia multivorans]